MLTDKRHPHTADEPHLPRLAQLCDNLADVIAGQDAEALAARTTPNAGTVVAVLPSWAWMIPAIDVGRKGTAADGTPQTMPIRLIWEGGSVIVANAGEVTLNWRLSGLGHDRTGTSTVRISDLSASAKIVLDEEADIYVFAMFLNAATFTQQERVLHRLAQAGITARWDLMTGFEQFARIKVQAANNVVAAEIAQHKGVPLNGVIDDITVDDIVSALMYGQNGTSVIQRMVDSALGPDKFRNVDPMRFFTVNIRARAEEAVRRHIGDPKIGAKVRRVFAKSKASSLDELIEAYKALYPNDSLAKKRALAALSAGPDIATTQRMYRDETTAAAEPGEDDR